MVRVYTHVMCPHIMFCPHSLYTQIILFAKLKLLLKIFNEIHVNMTKSIEYNTTYGTEKLRPVRVGTFSKAEELGHRFW